MKLSYQHDSGQYREDHNKLEDTKECKDKDNKPELQHLHLPAFGTDLAIYFCVLPRLSVL
jgi:hypothetical protein